jgi:hypothetical protein
MISATVTALTSCSRHSRPAASRIAPRFSVISSQLLAKSMQTRGSPQSWQPRLDCCRMRMLDFKYAITALPA